MKLFIQTLLLLSIAFPAFSAVKVGDQVSAIKIQNQFEETAELTADTQWIIFSSDMKAAKLLTEYLSEENAKKTDLSKTLIISDISKMPGMISKMFAIPKMKKYAFKLALDKTGEATKDFPRQEGSLTVIKVAQFKVESIEQLSSSEAVKSFFVGKQLSVVPQ
jgi:hypothetical protein